MRLLAAAAVAAVVLSGCGGSDLSASAEKVLKADAARVAQAAKAGNAAALRTAVARLRQDVAAQRADGNLSQERATRVLDAAAAVLADVPLPAPKATPSPSAAPKPVATRDGGGEHPKRKGRGKHDD